MSTPERKPKMSTARKWAARVALATPAPIALVWYYALGKPSLAEIAWPWKDGKGRPVAPDPVELAALGRVSNPRRRASPAYRSGEYLTELQRRKAGGSRAQLALPFPRGAARLVARWMRLYPTRSGPPSEELRERCKGKSGVYAIRDRHTGRVVYVGESHTGRLWKTLLRHFQDPSGKFEAEGEAVYRDRSRYDVAVWTTPAEWAFAFEQARIEALQPEDNIKGPGASLAAEEAPF